MFTFIGNLVSGLAAFFRLKEKRLDLDNSPEMQANAKAQQRAEIKEDATKAVASDDLEKIRKLAGE
jgi:hypothetical protein